MGIRNKIIRGAIPALLIHISIGSVYAWSLFVKPISEYIGKSPQQVQFAFSLAIFFLGMSAAFGGRLVEQNIKKSTLISMICFCSGLFITALSVYFKSLIGIYCGYGLLMGIGLGVGYISPIKTLMLWFKDNKGFATGIAVCAFGFASAVASPLITYLTNRFSLPKTFIILGIIYIVPMFVAHLLIKKPKGYIETVDRSDFKILSMFKNKTFIAIWIMLYINISCGLALISIASPIMSELSISVITITTVISIMGVFNGLGRIGFSTISDKFKNRILIYIIIFTLSFVTLCLTMKYPQLICIALITISACYGAGFSCLPSLLSDKFGMNNISKIHGLSLTAWALAGLTGNQISGLIKSVTGEYTKVFPILIILYLIGLIISIIFIVKNNRIEVK